MLPFRNEFVTPSVSYGLYQAPNQAHNSEETSQNSFTLFAQETDNLIPCAEL